MKFVCLADTHNLHNELEVPDGDVLLHAGDISMRGKIDAIKDFNRFLETLPHPHKILIAGNHDFLFEHEPKVAQSLITNAIYLEDSEVEIEGIRIYGSPWQPWFFDWAFNLQRGPEIKAKWDLIPEGIDILITHGPPMGHGDKTMKGDIAGCEDLLETIRRIKPKYHLFGHIHEGYGIIKEGDITCINASNVNVYYKPVNAPIVFDL